MEKINTIIWNPYPIRCLTAAGTIPSAGLYPARTTRWYELEYILEGSGHITTNGVDIPALPGTLFLRPPGLPVQGHLPYRSILIIFDLCFSPDRLSKYEETEFLDGGVPEKSPLLEAEALRIPTGEPAQEWLQEFTEAYLSSVSHRWLTMKLLLLQTLRFLLEQRAESVPLSRSLTLHARKITDLQSHIRAHLADPFSLKQAAELCGLSEGFLCRTFRKLNGVSLIEYVNQTKISYAKRLLSETDLPVKAIASAAGFQTETYFYTLFKRIEGVTPTRFREMHRYP